MTDQNPLLETSDLPRFGKIAAEHVGPALDTILDASHRCVKQLEALGADATWENFVEPLEDMEDRLERVWAPVSHLNSVMDTPEFRKVHDAGLRRITEFHTALGQNEGIFRGFEAVAASEAFAGFDEARRKVVENALRDFRLSGVALEGAARTRFKEISERLSDLGNRFSQNVLDATDAWVLKLTSAEDVSGLPESALELARQEAAANGEEGYVFTLKAPSFIPFMTYADSRPLRRRMYEAYVTRASEIGPDAGRFDNAETIHEILTLRREKARLLGFDNFAEYSLQTKMADSEDEVRAFLLDLADRCLPAAGRELDELREFANRQDAVETLQAWDLAYYSEKLKQERYELSEEELRPWFPLPRVLKGMFTVVERLFGVAVRPVEGVEAWHEDVQSFEIDLYARAKKRGGAWMGDCVSRRRHGGVLQRPVAFLVCNFSPPVGDRPALLTHDEVTTLFHEFGHGLHHMLTQVDYSPVSGINGVAWDAVELPSQFLENWCWESEALDLVSAHFQSGERLPPEILERLRAGRNFQAAMQMLRQVEFALFDLELHSTYEPESSQSVQSVLDAVRDRVAVVKPPEFNRFQNSFSHIFGGGYAAGYYSYKWAEVLSADAFARFEENGIFDADTGRDFLVNILEKGGTRDAMELFVAFRGREPDISALLRHSGLAA